MPRTSRSTKRNSSKKSRELDPPADKKRSRVSSVDEESVTKKPSIISFKPSKQSPDACKNSTMNMRNTQRYFFPPPPAPPPPQQAIMMGAPMPSIPPLYDPYSQFNGSMPFQFPQLMHHQYPLPQGVIVPSNDPHMIFQHNAHGQVPMTNVSGLNSERMAGQDSSNPVSVPPQLTDENSLDRGSVALDVLADLSGLVGDSITSHGVRSIRKELVVQQYQVALLLSSKLFQFIKWVLNGSELDDSVDHVTYNEVNEYYLVAKELAETLGDWKDILDSNAPFRGIDPEELLLEVVVFGTTDPNIRLVLPPYQNPDENVKDLKPWDTDRRSDSFSSIVLHESDRLEPQVVEEVRKLMIDRCSQCGNEEADEWFRGPSGEKTLCYDCGQFFQNLERKAGTELAGLILSQRKVHGFPLDRRVPVALLSDAPVQYYVLIDLETGKRRELQLRDFKSSSLFDNSVDPPRLKRKIALMPLLDRIATEPIDSMTVNSKYDPSHEIKNYKETQLERERKIVETEGRDEDLIESKLDMALNQEQPQSNLDPFSLRQE